MAGQTHSTAAETDRGERAAIETPHPPARRWARHFLSKQTVIALVCIAAAVSGAAWLNTTNSGAPASKGGLVVDESDLDLGDVWVTNEFGWTLRVRNTTNESIEVLNIGTSCGCLDIEPRRFVIGPRRTIELATKLDLTPRNIEDGAQRERPFAVYFAPETKGGRLPAWRLTGRVRGALYLLEEHLEFGDALVEGTDFRTRSALLRTLSPATTVVAAWDRAVLESVVVRREGSTYDCWSAAVRPRSELPLGNFETDVALTARGTGGEFLGRVVLPVYGTVVSDVQADPSQLLLGAVRFEDVVHKELLLHSRSGALFRVENVSHGGRIRNVSLRPASDDLAAQHVCSFDYVANDEESAGEAATDLEFIVAREDGRHRNICVSVRAYHVSKHEVSVSLDKH